jgi:hypothetical protein
MDYNSTSRIDSCTEVEIHVSLRPFPKPTLQVFELQTEILDITILGSLGWEVNNLFTHTSHGRSDYQGSRGLNPLVTHNVTASSISGEIFGYYTADAHLHLHNQRGMIGFYLIPRWNTELPIAPKSILVSNLEGDIHAELVQYY